MMLSVVASASLSCLTAPKQFQSAGRHATLNFAFFRYRFLSYTLRNATLQANLHFGHTPIVSSGVGHRECIDLDFFAGVFAGRGTRPLHLLLFAVAQTVPDAQPSSPSVLFHQAQPSSKKQTCLAVASRPTNSAAVPKRAGLMCGKPAIHPAACRQQKCKLQELIITVISL